jgi:hypothetical protein
MLRTGNGVDNARWGRVEFCNVRVCFREGFPKLPLTAQAGFGGAKNYCVSCSGNTMASIFFSPGQAVLLRNPNKSIQSFGISSCSAYLGTAIFGGRKSAAPLRRTYGASTVTDSPQTAAEPDSKTSHTVSTSFLMCRGRSQPRVLAVSIREQQARM